LSSEAEVRAGGKNGGNTPETAYNGVTTTTYWYRTPAEFFSAEESGDTDDADTSSGSVGILDSEGVVRNMRASGTWIHLPNINGVTPYGDARSIRQRYPVYPLHVSGNTAWKELQAFQALQLTGDNSMTTAVREEALGVTFELTFGNGHIHTIDIDGHTLVTKLRNVGDTYIASSSLQNGHEHQVTIKRVQDGEFEMIAMDPPEPHRLIVIKGISKTKDSAVTANGHLEENPTPATTPAVQSAVTTQQLNAIYRKMAEMENKIDELQSQVGDAGTCSSLQDVKDTLETLVAQSSATNSTNSTCWTCSQCGYVYDSDRDGDGEAFGNLPSDWCCPNCGAPKSAYTQMPESPSTEAPWKCGVCGYVYEADRDGNGASFDALPDSWTCPNCGAPKSAYKQEMNRRLQEAQWVHSH